MSRRFSLGALVGVIAVCVIGVWPALAAYPPTATIDKPADGTTWNGGSSTDFHVTGNAATDSGDSITRVTARVVPTDKGTHSYNQTQAWTDSQSTRAFDITIFPDWNGKYRVTVVATGKACSILGCTQDQDGPASAPRDVVLAVPPKTPTGPSAKLSSGKVTFSWDGNNTEGDLLGYIVERSFDGGDYKCFTQVTLDNTKPRQETYSIVDDLSSEPSGDYQWRVKAIRASDADSAMSTCQKAGTGIASVPSQRAFIKWSNPTATTTTTTPGGSTTTTTKPKAGAGAGDSSSKIPAGKRPNLSALGGFSVSNNLAAPPRARGEVDPGFNELLPFKAPDESAPEDGGAALPQTPLPADNSDNGNTPLLFVAAGLLVLVLSGHVLWLKAQVDRMPLEPLAPVD